MNWNAAAYYVALVLVIGGFGVIGAAAGVRVAIATVVRALECGALTGIDCAPVLRELNATARTFLIGGAVAMVCGSIGLWGIQQTVANAEEAPADA